LEAEGNGPNMTLSAWIPSVWLLLVLLVQGTCVGVAEAAPSRPDLSGYLSVPLKKTSHNQLLVAVLVNGHPATFLVDTGAPHVGIEQARVAALSIEPLGANGPQAPTVQTNGQAHRLAVINSLQVGGITLNRVPGVLFDLAAVTTQGAPSRAKSIDGILGLDVLTALHAVVDCTQPALLIAPLAGAAPSLGQRLTKAGWTEVPLLHAGKHLIVGTRLGEAPASLVVDTGAGASLLDNRFIATNPRSLSSRTYTAEGIHFKTTSARSIRLNHLRIGGHEVNSSYALVCNFPDLIGSDPELRAAGVSGLLGVQTLVAAEAFIDCQSAMLYVRRRRLKFTFGHGN